MVNGFGPCAEGKPPARAARLVADFPAGSRLVFMNRLAWDSTFEDRFVAYGKRPFPFYCHAF